MTSYTHENDSENVAPVKMFFSQPAIKNQVLSQDDKSASYIIFQNNELHTKLETLKNEYKELENEKWELDSDVDGLTKTRTCLQGYFKNEHIISTNWKNIALNYKFTLNNYKKQWNIYYLINVLMMCLITIIYNREIRISIMCIHASVYVYLNYKKNKDLSNEWCCNNVNIAAYEENSNLDKANSYIEELIDNM